MLRFGDFEIRRARNVLYDRLCAHWAVQPLKCPTVYSVRYRVGTSLPPPPPTQVLWRNFTGYPNRNWKYDSITGLSTRSTTRLQHETWSDLRPKYRQRWRNDRSINQILVLDSFIGLKKEHWEIFDAIAWRSNFQFYFTNLSSMKMFKKMWTLTVTSIKMLKIISLMSRDSCVVSAGWCVL